MAKCHTPFQSRDHEGSLSIDGTNLEEVPYGKTNIVAIMKERKSEIPNMLLA